MTRVDEILEIIDTGLQKPAMFGYGHDRAGCCWRCGFLSETELCGDCREVLLDGFVEDTPAEEPNQTYDTERRV